MKQRLILLPLLAILLLFSSCASRYELVLPNRGQLTTADLSQQNVALGYKYNVLTRKYANRAAKKDLRVVAVQLTNNTNRDLVVGESVVFVNDKGTPINALLPAQTFSKIKQRPPLYLLYLLFGFFGIKNPNQTPEKVYPVGLPLGAGLAGGNMYLAYSANQKFKKDLIGYDILGKTIKPGATVSGLLSFEADQYPQLNVQVVD